MSVGWEIPEALKGKLRDLLAGYLAAGQIPGHVHSTVRSFLHGVHAASNSGVELISAEQDEAVFRLASALESGSGTAAEVVAAVQETYGMLGRSFTIATESQGVVQLRMSEDLTQTEPTWRDNAMFATWSERLADERFGGTEALQALAMVLVRSDPDFGARILVSTEPSTALWGLTALLLRGWPGSAAAEVLRAILDRYRRPEATLLIGGKRQAPPV